LNADPGNPGYKRIIFCPEPVKDVSWTSYSNLTPYGISSIRWEKANARFITEIEVPVGSSAIVHIPSGDKDSVLEGGKKIKKRSGIMLKGSRDGYAVFEVRSGKYRFESNPVTSF